MHPLSRSFDEIQVFDNVAERTGNRVERAGIILAYLDEPSAYAVARAR